MAKSRASEASSSRPRTPPPPRMSGPGIAQIAIFCSLGAVVLTFIGVLMAGQSRSPAEDQAIDSLCAGLAVALTAPDPDWWDKDHGTWREAYLNAKKPFPGMEWPKLPKNITDKLAGADHSRREFNKERLFKRAVERNPLSGALRGMMIHFTVGNRSGQVVGARIDPARFQATRNLGAGISVGTATAAGGGGSFHARVYKAEYFGPGQGRVGDTYVIVSEAALSAGGAGIWLVLAPLLVAIAMGVLIVQANKTSEGLKGVARDLETIGRGKLDVRVATGASGEVGFLQRTTERMLKNLQLIQSTGSGDLDEAIEKELDVTNQIHQSLRPSDPPRVPGYELETLFKPGREIGGDYFDYVELSEGRVAILIADCSENLRGVPAAMVMAMTRAYLKSAINPSEGPGDWLRWVNRRLARDLKSGMAVTALCLLLDTNTNEVLAASAGHRPIIIWRKGKSATVNPNGIALGLDVGPVFDKTLEEKKISLQKGDRLVVYTDGVVSAQNEDGEAYGEGRFLDSIRRQGAMNSAAFVNFVAGAVDKFQADAEQSDDITISTLKRMK